MRRPKEALPPVPSCAPTLLGPAPVAAERLEGLYGRTNLFTRTIALHEGLSREAAWQTFGHEVMHLILADAGFNGRLKHVLEEQLCDAFGTWLTHAVCSGAITLKDSP